MQSPTFALLIVDVQKAMSDLNGEYAEVLGTEQALRLLIRS
jgi:hypothetical protein